MATETVAYLGLNSTTGKWEIRKQQVQDTVYGIGKEVKTPYLLGLVTEQGILTKEAALAEMNLPKWGPGQNQLFHELLPILPAKVPPKITIYDDELQWIEFDPIDESTWPTSDPTIYNPTRYWEGQDVEGKLYQGAGMSYIHASMWGSLGILRYRPFKNVGDPVTIDNPQYPIVEAERAIKLAEYTAVVRQYLVPLGNYQFQGLPIDGNYKWLIDNVEVPRDSAHRLAVVSTPSTWKWIMAPMRNPEIVNVNWRDPRTGEKGTWVWNMFDKTYDQRITASIDYVPPIGTIQGRLRKLLSIIF